MKNLITLNLRQFPVQAHDHRTGKETTIAVTVTKEQLQAAGVVGQSSKELIGRLCERQGYSVLEIGRPVKLQIPINLGELVRQYAEHQDAKAKWDYLYGGGAE